MKAPVAERVDLPISGMTCAACARAIERTLSATGGVERASVNLATNTATVEFDAARTGVGDFVSAIEDLGYGVPETEPPPDAGEKLYRARLIVAILFAAPVVALGMAHTARLRCRWCSIRARHFTARRGARCGTPAPT